MKEKKGAFANSTTGYGKKYNSCANRHTQKSQKPAEGAQKTLKNDEPPKPKPGDDDTDLNSGFGEYLRSGEGVEMMKMFVFANTVMLIVTHAYPLLKEQYIWFMAWFHNFKEEY